ncbi:FkbM family methyltransferase [Halioxenophilus sp. WMMB6]|uniref:FkbM family methyltransferase n=1 Tax=Halioxenophilus sp. WMMB6 TaxID=3073815 RepID=UPI00295EB585|nr:FkbM family methyltransferase [Halioxenophilus sp. WMMB6]
MTISALPAYAFGYNEHTEALAKFYPLLGIIDEFSNAKTILGLPRLTLADIDPTAPIINCVYNSRAYQAQARLKSLQFATVIFIGEIISQWPENFRNTMLAEAYLGIKNDLSLVRSWALDFADTRSQIEFEAVLAFRESLNIDYLADFEVKIDQQYFEPFLLDRNYCHLIDGGAFDGCDSLKFAEYYPDYQSIKLLEPSARNRSLIANNLAGLDNIEVLPACLGDRCDVVHFSGTGTSAKIVTTGGDAVDMTTIDHLLTDDATLVKLDIEGAEMMALSGASKALQSAHVGFAVSAYHLPDDFKNIWQWLRSAEVPRQFYFRHYSGGIAESVLFAL